MEGVAVAMGMPFDDLFEIVADRPGQDARYWLDSTAIERAVGWKAEIDLSEGLAEMADWGRTYLDQLRDWPMTYTLRA
jgi:dTDP-glucose 4,6-dehydratase